MKNDHSNSTSSQRARIADYLNYSLSPEATPEAINTRANVALAECKADSTAKCNTTKLKVGQV